MTLSLGRAWDETKAVFASDGGLIATVALALMVLPGTVVGLFAPPSADAAEAPAWVAIVGLVGALVSFAGQLAITRIGLGHRSTVGEAIGLGFRRLPAFVVATLIVGLPVMLLLLGPLLVAGGGEIPEKPPIAIALLFVVLFPVIIYLLVRLLFVSPATVDSTLGPVALVKRSWALTKGRAGKLFGLVALVLVAGIVLVVGLGGALGTVIILLLGAPEPGNVSALLLALEQQLLNAVVTAVFVVMVSRLYLQAAHGQVEASVPDAGHH